MEDGQTDVYGSVQNVLQMSHAMPGSDSKTRVHVPIRSGEPEF